MTTQRLDGPFSATRRYGISPFPLAFDILTLPFQVSNMLTGIPPLDIPAFNGEAAAPAPAPAPPSGGGVEGSFDVVGISPMQSGLGLQAVGVGTQSFASVRVTWNGQVRNTGNAPLVGGMVRLRAMASPAGTVIRETSAALPNLAPGASAPASLSVDVLSSDPPSSFFATLGVEIAGQVLGLLTSPALGNIFAVTGVAIEGTFGI